MFVSRKLGKLYVRKGNEPIFDTPVTISHPETPIGTYLFTAGRPTTTGSKLHWLVQSSQAVRQPSIRRRRSSERRGARQGSRRGARSGVADLGHRGARPHPDPAGSARPHFAPLVTSGASLIVSDLGMSGETGKDTDFIILAR